MRGVVVAMLGLGLAPPALAADYAVLRGSTGYEVPIVAYRNWEGFYVGGQVGTGGGGANFRNAAQSVIGAAIAHSWLVDQGVGSWATAEKGDTGQALQYGAFIGYNAQWGDVVLGLEASYNHTKLSAVASGRTPVNGGLFLTDPSNYKHSVSAEATSMISLSDFTTVRARAGWAFDSFLPYVTAGVALGRASYSTSALVGYPDSIYNGDPADPAKPADPGPWSSGIVTEGKSNSLIYGWSAGLGIDWALTHNVFLRAEYEFIQFSQARLNLNNARAGLGVKF